MSTRSLIAVCLPDDAYRSVYCHFDGYDYGQGVGTTLRAYYNSEEQARALIELGDLSSIKAEEVCAYHRDRGEAWSQTQPRLSASEDNLIKLARERGADYLYLFGEGSWTAKRLYGFC